MPALGLGTWKSEPGEVYSAVQIAISCGYRHIDCAPIYDNEQEIGQAISECIEKGMVNRDELWITSKLWNNAHAKQDVLPALQQTLDDLKLEYLDLFLIHWPVALKKEVTFPSSGEDFIFTNDLPLIETWEGMMECQKNGLSKHIGVSNFGIQNLEIILANSTIKPEINQVESHPYLSQTELLDFCNSQGIHLTAYSPLGSSDRPDRLKSEDEVPLLDDITIGEIARSKNATIAQILISWALHRGISVIPKSVNKERIIQNFNASDIHLSESEMNRINGLNKDYRYISGSFWTMEGSPYSLEDVWK
jgi:alcohol dehydrogenase (NADP+)